MHPRNLMTALTGCLLFFARGLCLAEDKPTVAPFLTIKLMDDAGKPVEGAKVGLFVMLRDYDPKTGGKWNFIHEITSDANGIATYQEVVERFKTQPLLYARHPERQLVGLQDFIGQDFSQRITLTILPECHCVLRLKSKELEQHGRSIERARGFVSRDPMHLFWCFAGPDAVVHAFLPAGSYDMFASGSNCCEISLPFEIKPGVRELDLGERDLPANPLALLEGKPAPEIRDVIEWKNGPGITLSELRGKVVILDFWGWWCGSCIERGIPELMQLNEEFQNRGLMIIGIHTPADEDDDVDSVIKLDAKLAEVRTTTWKGKDLTYPVALTKYHKGRYSPRGDENATSLMCVDYGISSWPTNVLIGRDGNVVGTFDASKPSDRDKLKRLLDAK